MSATINCREFAEYFSTQIRGKINPAYVFEVEGAPYAVEEFYLDDLRNHFSYRPLHLDDPQISVAMYSVAISLIQSFDEMECKDSSGITVSERGSVLVFLPGIHEISYMQEALAKLAHKRLQVYPLHSTVTLEEQNNVFLAPVPGYRKVILSTNIAESSVTVPDVKYVIDFCLARHLVCDLDTNYQSLRLTWASKTNCNQRKGRAGRVSKGYCYRLLTKAFWKNEIPDYMVPEMLLAPLGSILLKVKLLDMGDPCSLLSSALSPPKLSDIVKTVLQLKEMGALSVKSNDKTQNEDGELTFLGRMLAHLPVDLYLGKMIVLGHAFGCLDQCLIIGQFTTPKGFCYYILYFPDCHTFFFFFLNSRLNEMDWGKENFIQIKRIKEVAELYEDLKRRVSQFNMHVPDDVQPLDYTSMHMQKFILQVVIAGAYYPNYFVQNEIDEELASRELSGFNPQTTVMLRNLPPYSFLYYKQLQSLFRLCGQVKAISFNNSRAYVEFHRTSTDSGVLPEVSLAFLLGQQGRPLELSVYPCSESEGAHNIEVQFCVLLLCRVNVNLQSQSVYPVGVLSSAIDPNELPPDRLFVINITEVVEVGHFWGFQADEASLEKQRHLTAAINMHTLSSISGAIYPNLLCLAPYTELSEQSLYYRAKILHQRYNKVEVFFVDFGNTAVVDRTSLRELPPDLLSHPFQAQEFQVIGMCPSAQSIILGNQWSSRARDRFITLVKGHSLIVSLYSILHGVMRVQLLINTETTNTSVVDILVEEGHAVKTEESFDSKVTQHSWKERNKEDKELIDLLLNHFSQSPQPCSDAKVKYTGTCPFTTCPWHMCGHFFSTYTQLNKCTY
uniref:RNA helicase n=1 Tax=Mastacembelus armatus TaxID=205130 RepID=A0A7N8X5C7_9TELE